jgi:hypothetical protein
LDHVFDDLLERFACL